MKPADVFLAVTVAVIWGLAFVASRIALDEFSPALMTTLRFAIAAVAVPVRAATESLVADLDCHQLHAVSLGQFLAQAYGIAHGVPVGLSSVIVQSQALFTIGFAAIVFGELPTRMQTIGIVIAVAGLLMICGTVGYDFSVGAFAVLMICPISFAIGNLLLRRAQGVRMFDLFAWLCLAAAVPLVALTLVGDGVLPTWQALSHMSLTGLLCMLGPAASPPVSPIGCGPAAARLHRRTGGAVRAAGAVRWRRCVERRIRRKPLDRCGSPA